MKKYYAHTNGPDPEKWQLLEDHLTNVSDLAGQFAAAFGAEDWGWNAGWLHDLGKATNAFQEYIRKENEYEDEEYAADGSVSNHASAGAAYAFDRIGGGGRLLAYLLAGHHTGLPDYYTENPGHLPLRTRLEEGRRNLATIETCATALASRLRPLRKPDFLTAATAHMWTRMLFSCLIDADRLDTENYCDPDRARHRGVFPSLGTLADPFFQALEALEINAPPSEVNQIRAEIRRICEAAAMNDPGIFTLEVPTGGGKTLSAMAFAFRHALKHGKRRIIYVIPYTSIIEQTAKVLGDILGPESIVEHHSNVGTSGRSLAKELATENWDAPIIVTTNVQFLESLYTAHTGQARKLHNIVNSVVIMDEAQLLPPTLLTPVVDAMNQLVADYGVSLVLATATQPALPNLKTPTRIIPADARLHERLKRTEVIGPVCLSESVEWPDLARELANYPQVLCVVNTRRDCHELFTLMPSGTIHLSALMCGQHRSETISTIKARLKAGVDCRVVSTQLVEAGVDIDFPVVYRAMTGLDSIAQAAGRCNREGRLNAEGRLGQVHVFCPPKSAPPGLMRKAESTTRELWSLSGFDPEDPDWFTRYFEQFYAGVNDTGRQFYDWLIRDVQPGMEIQFRSASRAFSIIDDSQQQAVLVRWGESNRWLDELRRIGPTRDNLRALQRSVVNISRKTFDMAKERGLIEEIGGGYWLWIGRYHEGVGLDLYDGSWQPEELVI